MKIAALTVLCLSFILTEGSFEQKFSEDDEISVSFDLRALQDELREERKERSAMLQRIEELEQRQDLPPRSLEKRQDLPPRMSSKRTVTLAAGKARFTAVAYSGKETITLSCPSETRTIQIVDAYAAVFEVACAGGECPPNPYVDCARSLQEIDDMGFTFLKMRCDTKKTCEYFNNGLPVSSCGGKGSNYVQIYYDCLPVVTNEPVGFSAYAKESQAYVANQTLAFSEITTNFGSYYNSVTSTFHCPRHGIYMFSIHYNAKDALGLTVEVLKNNVLQAETVASTGAAFNHASAFFVIECDVQDIVWARSTGAGHVSADNMRSQFSGHLLYCLPETPEDPDTL